MAEAKSFKDLPLLYNKGASSALRANTYPDDAKDVIPITHSPNTTEQQDYAIPLSQIGVSTVGTCDTSADTQTKVVDVISGSFPFNTENSDEAIGREILVKFTNKNTANNPKIKIGNIEAKSIVCIGGTATVGSGCWEAGATMKFTFDGENWLMHSNTAQKTDSYTILADGTTVYTKAQTDSTINGALADYGKLNFIGSPYISDTLNNAKTVGNYRVGLEATNKPYNSSGYLTVIKRRDDIITQIFYGDNNLMALRSFTTSWSDWEKLATETDLTDYNKSIGFDDTVATDKGELIKKKALKAIDKGLKNNCTCTLAGGWQGNQFGVSIITRLGTKYFVQFYGNNGWTIEGCYDTSSEEILFFTTSVTSSTTEYFSINSDIATLGDVKIYEILRIINIQRLLFTLKNNVTSGSSVHIGTIANEKKPKQTTRVTMHDTNTHISYECFIEVTNGQIMLRPNTNINAGSTIAMDNFTYIY